MNIENLKAQVKAVEKLLRKGATMGPEGHRRLRDTKRLLLEHDHGKGAVAARRSRATGTLRVLYRPGSQMIEEDGWLLVCDDHGFCIHTETRTQGEAALGDAGWCEECQAKAS